jgi:hypothetical protein
MESILINEQTAIKQAFQMIYQPKQAFQATSVTESAVILEIELDSPIENQRRELYQQIKDLFADGLSIRKIGYKLEISRNTVRKHLRVTDFPPRQSGQGSKSGSTANLVESDRIGKCLPSNFLIYC